MKTWGIFWMVVLSGAVLQAADLPRYALPVGRALTYSSESSSKEPGGIDLTSRTKWRTIVVSENPDGSRRVILRMSSAMAQGGRPEQERVTIGYVDLFPDGRSLPNPTVGPQLNVSGIFPRLPATEAEAASKWQHEDPATLTTTKFVRAADKARGFFNFSSTQDGALSRIYVTTSVQFFQFELSKGILVSADTKTSQRYGFNSTGTSTTKLEKDEIIPADQIQALAKDYDALIKAQILVNGLIDNVAEHPQQGALLLQEVQAKSSALGNGVQSEEVKQQFVELSKRTTEMKSYVEDLAGRLKGVVNKPAADWAAKDWDGGDWSQQKLAGKVVVMDFWYRGCGWCMYAMPQVRQLAIDYKDKPVAVLGMNTDQKEEDARLVMKELDLKYPQIRSAELTQKFGVQVFPTTIVIDQKGIVRAVFIGYSPDLGEKLSRKVDSLLKTAG